MKVNSELEAILSGNTSAYDRLIEEELKERNIYLNDQIDEDVIENAVMHILRFNREDKHKPISERKPIRIYMNSPGGSVVDGLVLVDAIIQSKTPVHGILLGMAYSMCGYVLIVCDERYALPHSSVLIHDGTAGAMTSGNKFKDLAKFYESLDKKTKHLIVSRTKISSELYEEKRDREFYFFADEGKELGVIDKIIGVDCELDDVI